MKDELARTVFRTLRAMALATGLLLLAFCLPTIRLDSLWAAWVVGWTNSGDVLGVVLLGLTMATLLIFRKALPWRRRLQELAIHIVVLALLQGGGALINEHLIKPSMAVPRPNIVWLADGGVLGMTADEFYQILDRSERRDVLERILSDPESDAIELSDGVRQHWIHEIGYSLPSGHTFAAMLLATYFLAMGTHFVRNRKRRIVYCLPVWAVLIGWSRVLLMVHRPMDVLVGGALGVLLGVLAAVLTIRWLRH